MKCFLFGVLLFLSIFSRPSKANEMETLNACVANFTHRVLFYQSSLPALLWRLDGNLHRLSQLPILFQENVVALEKKSILGANASAEFHLAANALQSCEIKIRQFEARVKYFLALVCLLPTTIFLMALYLLLYPPWEWLLFSVTPAIATSLSKKNKIGCILAIMSTFLAASEVASAIPLTIYTYDSFVSKGSLGEFVKTAFKAKTGKEVEFIRFGSAGEALNQISLEGEKSSADLLLGVDNSLLYRAKATGFFAPLKPNNLSTLKPETLYDSDSQFIPFDYGYLAFLFDSDSLKKKGIVLEGMSLEKFAGMAAFKKKVVIEDPRTSSIGFSFLLWSRSLFSKREALDSFWRNLSGRLLTIAPGWSGAYGIFLKGEVDWVLSYTTSPAYHIETEKKHNIQALIFPEGHFRQVEGIGMLRFSKNKKLAIEFVEFLLSKEVQSALPLKQWMYPVSKEVVLPKSFVQLKIPKTIPSVPPFTEDERKKWLADWTELLSAQK